MQAFFLIFVRVIVICLMILAGGLARKRGILTGESTRGLALLSTNFIYPAAIYSSLVGNFELGGILSRWTLPAGTLMIMAIGFVVGGVVSHLVGGFRPPERRMFHFQSTINNYVFLPMPLVMAAYGDAGVGLLSLSSIGSELAVWTFGVIAISGGLNGRQMRNILNMPMLAIVLSVLTLWARHCWPGVFGSGFFADAFDSFLSTAKLFGGATVAIAMVVAGSRMVELKLSSLRPVFHAWLVPLRLLLIPAVCVLCLRLLPFSEEAREVLGVVAIMPTSVASVALSDFFGADTESAASSVLLTHVFCIFTIPLWLTLLG